MKELSQKLTKRRLSIIFWLVLIIFIFFSAKYLASELDSGNTGEFSTKPTTKNIQPKNTINKVTLDKDEVLLKQQIAIAELNKRVQNLEMAMVKIRTENLLPKIILNFVELQDLIDSNQNYEKELRQLEILSRADFALSIKVAKLKSILKTNPKTNQDLSAEFANLIPRIKDRQAEIENKDGMLGTIKAKISKFVSIRRIGDKKTNSDIESLINKTQNDIASKKYISALENLNSMGGNYQQINSTIKINLQNSHNLQESINDFYQFLNALESV
ncbi:MAG: hypothetical protein ACJAZX_000605 [Rickettsiales bacterium]|jgi:hypothetical protein